jgi:DNA-directed RNA polymerase subunit RPC12/RpoP
MIRFKCIYCGQRILAREDGRGKKGKCPKCGHELRVPQTTKGRPAISSDKEPMPERPAPYVPEWDKDPRLGPDEPAEALTELFKESLGFLVPTYDKLSLSLMVVTLILLYLANIEMRNDLQAWTHQDWTQYRTSETIVFFTIFNFGLIASVVLFPRLSTRQKATDFIKKIMLVIAVLINAITGIIAGIYVVRNTTSFNWLIIFPIWNIINCVLLLLMLSYNLIDEECIVDSKATPVRVILGIVSVFIIFALCNYIFKLYWAITFSICIIYTTSFDRALQSVFPGLTHEEENEQVG